MAIAILDNWTRDQFVAAAGQTVFAYSFPIVDETYISVYQRGFDEEPNNTTQLLTLGVDYTVSGVGDEAGGEITLVVPATLNDVITVIGVEPIDRLSVFPDLNPFTIAMNQQLNELTIMIKEVETILYHLTPKYRFDELIYPAPNNVRQLNLELPILNDGYIWIGRGDYGDNPDDIIAAHIGSFEGFGFINAPYILAGDFPGLDNAQNLNDLGEGILYTTPNGAAPGQAQLSLLNIGPGLNLDLSTNTLDAAGSNVIAVEQQEHNFEVKNVIRMDRTTAKFQLALATTAELAEVCGFVIAAPDNDNFTYQMVGRSPAIFEGLTKGDVLFLSDEVPGLATNVEPSTPGHISLNLGIVMTETSIDIRHSRGMYIGFGGGGGAGPNPPEPPEDPTGTVESENETGTYVTTGTGWETVFCAQITPTSATNRVWIVADVAAGASGSGLPLYFRITRNGLPIFVGDADGARLQASGAVMHHFAGNPTNWFANYIDSPATKDTVTYCVEIRSPGGPGAYVNRTSTDSDSALFGRSSSTLTLIEIDAP